jgi:autotransporter translocation and assembly factor TamB
VQGWHASVLWAGKQALVEGEIGSVSGSYDGSEVRELGGRFHWAGNTLRAEGWRAGVLGGTLNIEGLVHLPDGELEQAEVYLSGGGESLDLAQLPAGVVALLPEELSGEGASELSGVVGTTFSAHWGSERGEAIAELDMRTTRLAGYEVERVQGLVMAELGPEGRWSVELPAATVRGAGFRAAIRGRGSPDTLDVAVELAGADLSQLGIQVKPGERELSGGRVYGAVELEGSLEAPRLSGDLAIFEAEYGLPQPASAVVRFTAQPKSLAGKDLIPPREATVDAYVSYDSALVRVNGEIRRPATELEAPSLQGDVRVAGLQLPAARELVGEAWPEKYALEGLASFAAQLSGTTLAPVADGNLSLTQVQYQDYYLEAIHAPWHGELSPEDEEYLTVRGGHVLAQGARLDFDGSLHEAFDDWNFEVRARAADVRLERMAALQQIRLPMAGEVLVPDIVLRGSAQGISGEGRVLADHVTLGQETLTGVDMHMVLTPGRLTVERARLGAAGGQVETQLTHDLTTQQVRGEMRVQEVAASPLLRIIAVLVASRAELDGAEAAAEPWIRLSVQTRGKISGEVDFSGPIETPAGEISLTLTDATYLDKALPEAKARVRYDVAEGAFDGIEAELQIGQGLVVVSGEARLDGDLDLTADASNLNLAAVRDWYPELWARFSDDVRAKLPRSLDVGGLASMVVVAEGSTRSPRLTASLDVVSASVQGVSFDLLSVPVVKIAEGGIDLTGILVKRGEREITGSGHLPFTWQPVSLPLTEPISFNARIANADLGLLPTIMQELQATAPAEGTAAAARPNPWLRTTARGMVNASLSLGGTLETPVLEGFASLEEGAFSRGTWPAPLSDLEAKVTIRSLRGVNRLEVEHASGRWDEVEFKLSGDMDLNSILTQELERNRYNLALTVATPEPQSWSGTMVSELHGRLALVTSPEEGHVLRLEGLGAQLGEGTVRGEGTVKITNWAIQSFGTNDWDMRVVAERAQVVYGGMFRGELEGALEITNPEPGETAVLAGTMTLQRAVFGLPEGGVAPSGPIQLAVAPRNYPPLGLHVNVGLGDDVRFQSAGVTAPLTPTTQALVLRGTIQAPEARGTVGLAPGAGRVTAGNLALASGVLSYASELPERRQRERTITITYRYDVLAEQTLASANVDGREMGPVYLTMRITGTDAAPPAVEVESEPPLTTDQILALVGFASFMPGGTTNLDQLLSQRVVSLLASGLREALLAPIEEELTRSLGLQEFSVMLTFDQPLQVTMGKYLVKNLMVNYRYTYVSAHDIRWNLGLSYQLPSKRNLVTFATNQSGDIQLRVSHSWSF